MRQKMATTGSLWLPSQGVCQVCGLSDESCSHTFHTRRVYSVSVTTLDKAALAAAHAGLQPMRSLMCVQRWYNNQSVQRPAAHTSNILC